MSALDKPTFRVLLLEDNGWDARAALEALWRGERATFHVTHVQSLADARAELARARYDAIVADLGLPDSTGVKTIEALRREAPFVALVSLTATVSSTGIPEAIAAGADEFVPKSCLSEESAFTLPRALLYAIRERQSRDRLEDLARQHEETLQAIPDVVARIDERGRIAWMNRPGLAFLGRKEDEVVGHDPAAFLDPAEAARAEREGGPPLALRGRLLVRLPGPDGRDRLIEWTSKQITDAAGNVTGAVGVGRDVTAANEAVAREKSLAAQRAETEKLQALQRERARFFNLMAHEVNNPLTVLIMQVDLLKQRLLGALSDEQERAVEILDRTLDRLRGLTADLLDTSRIQSGDLKLRPMRQDLGALVAESAAAYAPLAAKAGVALDVAAAPGVFAVVDPRRVTQVLVNYLTNALKFTPAGGRVAFELAREGPTAVLLVRDSGRGVPAKLQAQLFDAFSQAHADSPVKGSGLGLYICRGIAEAHGGTVGCESEGEGKGATFWMRLPIAPPEGA